MLSISSSRPWVCSPGRLAAAAALVALLIALVLMPPARSEAATLYQFEPSGTGAGISPESSVENYHHLWFGASPRRGKLYVFLAGSGADPGDYTTIANAAADDRLDAIGLRYPNAEKVADICGVDTSSSGTCYGQVRGETLFGENVSAPGGPYDASGFTVSKENSISNRLVQLLRYAAAQFPGQAWGLYLKSGGQYDGYEPDWSKIILAGHSQGGGHAAFAGDKISTLRRVNALAAPADFRNSLGAPAQWIDNGVDTGRASVFYGLVHESDPADGVILNNWSADNLAIPGSPTLVRDEQPYNGSQQLTTDLPPRDLESYHGSVAADLLVDRYSSGVPVLLPVWQYMWSGGGAY